MFLALKNGLGRLAVFFRGLFDEYGGAAAAYSLRRLGSAYSGPLVRVRRDSDDAELDFTSTTLIEDWVNGKQETTLPADVATSSAAYSLRKVKDTYTGDAVRIRRASDNYEVNVAFDTNGAVSASSLIEQAELGLNRAGVILFDGVDDDIDVNSALLPTSDFTLTIRAFVTSYPSVDATIFGQGTAAGTGRTVLQIQTDGQAFVFINGVGAFTTANTFNLNEINTIVFSRSGDDYSLTLNGGTAVTNNSSGSPEQVNSQIGDGYSGANFEGSIQSLTVGSVSWDGKQSSAESLGWTVNGSPELSVVVPTTLGEFLTEGGNQDAYVQTWYDQSGSGNNATQDVSGNQPKIAEAGSYLGKIDFDGSDDGLATTSNLTDTLQSLTMFAVTQDDSTSGSANMVRCRPNGNPGDFDGFSWEKETSDTYGANTFLEGVNGMVSAPTTGIGTRNTSENLNTLVFQQSQILAYENGTLDATLSSVRTGSVPVGNVTLVDQLWIGQNFDDNARPFDGSMKEIVIYFSDQSSNRFKIESNINNYYGIYTASHNGFVENWYDQSGNGNHAEQLTLGDQPQIVSNGNLLADGIDFDGVSDFFTASGVSTTQPYSVFMKIKASETGAVQQIIDSGSVDPAFFQFSTAGVLSINNPTSTVTSLDLTSTPTDVLISGFIDDPKTAFADGASILSPAAGTGTNSLSGLTIGKHRTISSSYYSGNFSELIIYDSDQSANRTGIESNIADHYGITLP